MGPIFKNITIIYTLKCNIACDHCVYHCSPDKHEKLDVKRVKVILNDVFAYGITSYTLSGGEPFIYYKEIKDILHYSHSIGMDVIIGTNGFWASTYQKTKFILKELSVLGLRLILLSADRYHQKFINLKNIINILEVSDEIGLDVKVTCIMTKNDKIGMDIVYKIKNYNCIVSLKEPKLYGRFAGVNREIENNLSKFIPDIESLGVPCDQIQFPVIDTCGRVWCCCGIPTIGPPVIESIQSPMFLGNIYNKSIDKILKENESNYILKMVKNRGFNELIKIIENKTGEKYKYGKYHYYCELCCELLGKKSNIKHLVDNALYSE
jgi:MoaA/NifB/PqqE/SkfB family radical SAM enzyme